MSPPDGNNVYDLTTAAEPLSEDDTMSIDTQVVLHGSHLTFPSKAAKADVECGLQSGKVVDVKVRPLR